MFPVWSLALSHIFQGYNEIQLLAEEIASLSPEHASHLHYALQQGKRIGELQGRTRHLVNFSVRSSLDPDQRVQIEAEIEEALRQVSLDLWRWHRALEDGLTRIEQMQFRSRTSSRTPSP